MKRKTIRRLLNDPMPSFKDNLIKEKEMPTEN
jgi:hypothetical protein